MEDKMVAGAFGWPALQIMGDTAADIVVLVDWWLWFVLFPSLAVISVLWVLFFIGAYQVAQFERDFSEYDPYALLELDKVSLKWFWAAVTARGQGQWIFITDRTAPIKLGQTQKQNTPLERANQNQ